MIKYLACIIIGSLISYSTVSQEVGVSVTANKNKILIGEQINLALEASIPSTVQGAGWFTFDTIPHFELINKGKIDTIATDFGYTYRQVLTVTSFDSGSWMIPSFMLQLNGKEYLTDTVPVEVGFSPFDPNQDYHDIKTIVDVPQNFLQKYKYWLIGAGALLLAVLLYFILRRRKKKPVTEAPKRKPSLNALDEAMQAMTALQKEGLLQSNQPKKHYVQLNEIIRNFLERRSGNDYHEKTNDEIMLQLKKLDWNNDALFVFAQQLRMLDAVKFAKYIPGEAENNQAFETIKKSIQSLDTIITKK